jgi:hypothetical protein
MQARCPRCASVFTTDRSGLQFCPNCGQQVDVPPFPGAPPESSGAGWGGPSGPGGPGSMGPGPAVREDTPWERRATIGWFTGLFETWKRTLFSPQPFWSSVKPNASWTDALFYAWILFAVGLLVSLPLDAVGFGALGSQSFIDQLKLPPDVRSNLHNALARTGFGLAKLFPFVLYPVLLILWAAIVHLFAMLFGAAKNGYFATFRVMAYASAPTVFSGFPCFGFLCFLYTLVLAILGISSVQETSLGRATATVLGPLAIVCCCVGGAISLAGAGILAALSHMQSQ